MRDILNPKSIAEWLRKQPADAIYAYGDVRGCVLFQYLRASGADVLSVGPFQWTGHENDKHPLPAGVNRAAVFEPRTYGAAAARFEALAKSEAT